MHQIGLASADVGFRMTPDTWLKMIQCPVSPGNSLPMICLGRISQVFCAEFFDVKFCPYQPLDASPIFAAVSKKHVSVYYALRVSLARLDQT